MGRADRVPPGLRRPALQRLPAPFFRSVVRRAVGGQRQHVPFASIVPPEQGGEHEAGAGETDEQENHRDHGGGTACRREPREHEPRLRPGSLQRRRQHGSKPCGGGDERNVEDHSSHVRHELREGKISRLTVCGGNIPGWRVAVHATSVKSVQANVWGRNGGSEPHCPCDRNHRFFPLMRAGSPSWHRTRQPHPAHRGVPPPSGDWSEPGEQVYT